MKKKFAIKALLLSLGALALNIDESQNLNIGYQAHANTTTAINFPIPDVKEVAKHIGRVGRANAVSFAIEQLFDGIDWVLDPANNRARIKFKEPTKLCGGSQNKQYWTQPKETVAKKYCADIGYANAHEYLLGLTNDKHPEFIEYRVDCDKGYGGVGFVYCGKQDSKETTLTYVEIASEIIKHAKRGHKPSITFLKEVDDLLKKATTTKPPVATQPKPTPANPPKDETKPDVKPKPPTPPKQPPKKEPEKSKDCKKTNSCPPCITISGRVVRVGTIGYRHDKVPPSKPHKPFVGDHYNLYKANQNPNNGKCFWQSIGAQDASNGLPPPPNSIPIEPFR